MLTGIGDPMIGRFLHYDALKRTLKHSIYEKTLIAVFGKKSNNKNHLKISGYDGESEFDEIDVVELAERLSEENLNLIDVRNPDEIESFTLKSLNLYLCPNWKSDSLK